MALKLCLNGQNGAFEVLIIKPLLADILNLCSRKHKTTKVTHRAKLLSGLVPDGGYGIPNKRQSSAGFQRRDYSNQTWTNICLRAALRVYTINYCSAP